MLNKDGWKLARISFSVVPISPLPVEATARAFQSCDVIRNGNSDARGLVVRHHFCRHSSVPEILAETRVETCG